MPKLTKRIVDAIRPDPGRDVFMWDDELKGFGVRVKPSGAGAFIVQYRTPERHTRRMVLGRIGVLTPEEGRRLAREKLAAVAGGADPSTDRREVLRDNQNHARCDN